MGIRRPNIELTEDAGGSEITYSAAIHMRIDNIGKTDADKLRAAMIASYKNNDRKEVKKQLKDLLGSGKPSGKKLIDALNDMPSDD